MTIQALPIIRINSSESSFYPSFPNCTITTRNPLYPIHVLETFSLPKLINDPARNSRFLVQPYPSILKFDLTSYFHQYWTDKPGKNCKGFFEIKILN
jgi:hypothetical protein